MSNMVVNLDCSVCIPHTHVHISTNTQKTQHVKAVLLSICQVQQLQPNGWAKTHCQHLLHTSSIGVQNIWHVLYIDPLPTFNLQKGLVAVPFAGASHETRATMVIHSAAVPLVLGKCTGSVLFTPQVGMHIGQELVRMHGQRRNATVIE